jgi:hypothetical protein
MAQAANSVAIRGALLLVLVAGALVSTADATRNSGLGAVNVASPPVTAVHPTYLLDCVMECATQATRCGISCATKPLLEGSLCAIDCFEANAKCVLECRHAPALGPMPHA